MLKKMLALVSLGLFIVLGSHPAMAQFGQMRGTVINEDGTPFVGAEILIDREDIRGHYELKTDKDGKFFHAGLPLGRYTISVVMSNGEKFSIGNIQTRMGSAQDVMINLQQERMRAEAAAAGVQLEGELSQEQIEAIEKLSAERAEQIKQRQELTGRFDAGMAAMAAQDYDTAIPEFEAAAEADPTQYAVFAQLGEAFSGKANNAPEVEKEEWYNKAIESYKRSLALKPDPAAQKNLSLALANAGRIEEAQADCVTAAELDLVSGAGCFFNLGAVLVNSNHMLEAAEAFRKATEADPNNVDAQYQLGVTLMNQITLDSDGNMIPAPGTVEALQKYIELAPDGPNADAVKGMLEALKSTVTTSIDLSND